MFLQFSVIPLLCFIFAVQSSPTYRRLGTSSCKPYDKCPSIDGWNRQGSFCFWFSASTDTWFGANRKCKRLGGFLAEPKNSDIDGYISRMGTSKDVMYWIGLSDLKREGKFVWKSSGQAVRYTNWRPGDPNNYKGIEHCGLTNWNKAGEGWVDAPCNWKMNYVCQAKLECAPGWHKKGKSCFWFSGITDTWYGAKEFCRKVGAFLAEPKDAETEKFITNDAIWKRVNSWIGLSDLKREGHFVWESSSESLRFSNWVPGDPNNYNGNEHCVLTNWHRKWADAPCTWRKHFVCQGNLW